MHKSAVPCIPKVCAYLTRNGRELLVFGGPGHDGLQIPKGTIEPGESPWDALEREVWEESGLTTLQDVEHLTSDVWTRRRTPPKRYHRHFFHAEVDTDRDTWIHVVTGDGAEQSAEFTYSWLELPTTREFALGLDDYVHLLS